MSDGVSDLVNVRLLNLCLGSEVSFGFGLNWGWIIVIMNSLDVFHHCFPFDYSVFVRRQNRMGQLECTEPWSLNFGHCFLSLLQVLLHFPHFLKIINDLILWLSLHNRLWVWLVHKIFGNRKIPFKLCQVLLSVPRLILCWIRSVECLFFVLPRGGFLVWVYTFFFKPSLFVFLPFLFSLSFRIREAFLTNFCDKLIPQILHLCFSFWRNSLKTSRISFLHVLKTHSVLARIVCIPSLFFSFQNFLELFLFSFFYFLMPFCF